MESTRGSRLFLHVSVLLGVLVASASLVTCSAADGLIGIHSAFLTGMEQLPTPTLIFEEGTSTVFVNNSVNVSASDSGSDVTYNWSVDGTGSVEETGSTVAYSAPANEEVATLSVYASADGFSDSPVASATITIEDNHFALLSSTASAAGGNINQSGGSYLVWNTDSIDSSYFARPSTTELEVSQAGDYFLALTIPMETAVERSSVRAEVHVNGVLHTGGITESSYVRNNTGNHSESSDHLAFLIPGLSVGDDISIEVHEAARNGTVTISGQATLYVEYLDSSRTVFAARSAASMDTTDLYVPPASAVPIEWQQQVADTGFTHSDLSNPEQITLNASGYYMVYANVPLYISGADTTNRVNIEFLIQLNGTTVDGGQAQQGYIRRQDNHQNSSVHWSGIIHAPSAGSVLTLAAHKESGATIADQTVTMNNKKATVFVESIDAGAFLFAGAATRPVGGTDFNSADSIAWENALVNDTITYTHSSALFDSNEVTFNRSGDYLVVYNDALIISGADIRLNPRIEFAVNGTPVSGAQTKSHYLRNDASAGNYESSGSLVFYLEGIAAGQTLTVTTTEEAETASAAIADDFALLTVIRKR